MLETTHDAVPHLLTALTGPIPELERKILDHQNQIESFFRSQWQTLQPPLYASVDLRNSGFKIAPVDTNLFPAGFNNLNKDFMALCVHAMQSTLERLMPKCQRVLIIPESHTRNRHYLENVYTLQNILNRSGYETRIGSLLADLTEEVTVDLHSGAELRLQPILREKDYLKLTDFKPCLILLNHDLSDGAPDILKNLAQPIVPPLAIGWTYRKKTQHFKHYEAVAQEFADLIDIDPWFINPLYRQCGKINFLSGEGELCLTEQVEAMLAVIREKYETYHIHKEPFVVVKADQGTYGMGVMMVRSTEELKNLNRKTRIKMSVTKGGQKITNVILQEGVYTFETFGKDNAVAEPVVYMIGRHVVGGFYRVHTKRGDTENLNAPGMHFEPLAFAHNCSSPESNRKNNLYCANRFYAYGVIARLALLASAKELQDLPREIS